MIRSYFQSKITFEVAGLHQGTLSDQLTHFASALAKQGVQEAQFHKPNIFLTMITTFGRSQNEYWKELVQSEVVLGDLFEK